jgi:hypothetical protein
MDDSAGTGCPVLLNEQAISHDPHPVHLSGWTRMVQRPGFGCRQLSLVVFGGLFLLCFAVNVRRNGLFKPRFLSIIFVCFVYYHTDLSVSPQLWPGKRTRALRKTPCVAYYSVRPAHGEP